MKIKLHTIIEELEHHAPFTALGALSGIAIFFIYNKLNFSHDTTYNIFYVLHPLHILFSAIVMTGIYKLHTQGKVLQNIIISFVGAVGIATISDSIIPFIGEKILGLPDSHAHIGFIEELPLVAIGAAIGIAIGFIKPTTKVPHAAHVLISTWASLFHMIMAAGTSISLISILIIPLFLFVAVWIPCCFSDIVFPLLFIKKTDIDIRCCSKTNK